MKKKKKRSELSIKRRAKKRQVFKQQDGRCYLCGGQMTMQNRCRNYATWDHVKPRAAGGGNGYGNKRLACFSCNHEKGDWPLKVYLDFKRRAVG